jgi:hypothetical protein
MSKYTWGNLQYEFYKPKVNNKKRAVLGSLIMADVILPATFGVGIFLSKLILRVKPLYLYQ